MDYLYSELNSSLVTEDDNVIEWKAYTTLPTPSAETYMQVAVLNVDSADLIYLCIKCASGYEWKLITSGSGAIPQLDTPVIALTNSTITWQPVDNAVSYSVYSGNTVIASNVTATSYDLSSKLIEPGTYSVKIKAIGDDTNYKTSEFSNSVSYTVIYKMYWGTKFDVPTTIDAEFVAEECPTTLKSNGAIHYFTTKTAGEIRGKHCIYAYPTYYGNLEHIYCNDLTSFDLISQWTKVVITYNNMSYNMYYANEATKDVDSKYQYLFILE